MILRVLILLFLLGACTPRFSQNNLSGERSLYLKKNKNSKIWWQQWSPKTLEHARKSNKLIYLSVGYASCFACERMNQENYNKENVADTLNQNFVSIMVDREERPDLDSYFLNLQSSIMKFGAWPINIVLSPDLKPLLATTFIKNKKFVPLLEKITKQWRESPQKMLNNSTDFLASIQPVEATHDYFAKDQQLIKDFYARYTHRFDTIYGGKRTGPNFAPKFPVNDEMRLLLRYYKQTGEPQAIKMVKKTMTTIALSAFFDQLEGGFHRYSSSRDWDTPNFEKMLVDQAGFLNTYLDSYLITNNKLYERVIEETISFLLKKFSNPLGGFYSSQSASLNGKDGFYYTWQDHEIQGLLKPEEWQLFNQYFTLNQKQRQYMLRRSLRKKTTFDNPKLGPIKFKILESKHKIQKPEIDKKVITATNAYLLSAFSRVIKTFPSDDFSIIIKGNLDFLISQHRTIWGELFRRSSGGEAKFKAILDDYAFLIDALIEYYQVSFDENYLLLAMKLQKQQDQLFYNSEKKLYKYSQNNDVQFTSPYLFKDQGAPSGLAVSYWNLLRLSQYYVDSSLLQKANDLIDSYPEQLQVDPISYSSLLLGLDYSISSPKTLIISSHSSKECQKHSQQIYKTYAPYTITSCLNKKSNLPLHKGKRQKNKETTFFVCSRESCSTEITSFEEAKKLLQ